MIDVHYTGRERLLLQLLQIFTDQLFIVFTDQLFTDREGAVHNMYGSDRLLLRSLLLKSSIRRGIRSCPAGFCFGMVAGRYTEENL